MKPNRFIDHVRNCLQVRRLLRDHDTPNLRNLFWYDLPLHYAVSWRGILHVLWWNLARRTDDEIAGNYALVNLYFAEPLGDGRDVPAPPVWHCRGLVSRPFFSDGGETQRILEENADTVVDEFRNLPSELATHPDNASLMDSGRWTGLFLFQASGERNEAVCTLFPKTASIVERLPLCRNFGFVMFSGLDAGSHVVAHCGSSNLRLRYHLGVEIPEPEAATLYVGRESRGWSQGKVFAFDDGYRHEVRHEGKQRRVALVIDVWHPSLTAEETAVLGDPVFQRFGKVAAA